MRRKEASQPPWVGRRRKEASQPPWVGIGRHIPGLYPPWYTHHSGYTLYHPVYASLYRHAGTAAHGPSADRAQSPGLREAKAPGQPDFWALGSPEVSRFLCSARVDRSCAHARTNERLDSARNSQGAGALGRRLRRRVVFGSARVLRAQNARRTVSCPRSPCF